MSDLRELLRQRLGGRVSVVNRSPYESGGNSQEGFAEEPAVEMDSAEREPGDPRSITGFTVRRAVDSSGQAVEIPTGVPPVQAPGGFGKLAVPRAAKADQHPQIPGQTERWTDVVATNSGVQLDRQAAFPIRSIWVDNYTPVWLRIHAVQRYVPPFTVGVCYPVYAGAQKVYVTAEAPPGITQPSAGTSKPVFTVEAYEREMPTSPGFFAGGASDGDASANGSGIETNDHMYAYNGTTWDRVRTAPVISSSFGTGTLAVGCAVIDGINAAAPPLMAVQGFRTVSAANTANQQVIDVSQLHDILDIVMTASAGTATLKVEGSVDNVNFVDIDDIAAAASTVKHYASAHGDVGATTAVCPLSYRYIRITSGAAGAGNTTTTTVSVK